MPLCYRLPLGHQSTSQPHVKNEVVLSENYLRTLLAGYQMGVRIGCVGENQVHL